MHQLWFSRFSTVVFQRNGKYSKLLIINLWDVWHLKSWALSRKKFQLAICGLQNFCMKGTKKKGEEQERAHLWSRKIISVKYWLLLWQDWDMFRYVNALLQKIEPLQWENCNVWGTVFIYRSEPVQTCYIYITCILLLSVRESQQRRLHGPALYVFKVKKLLVCEHVIGKKLSKTKISVR